MKQIKIDDEPQPSLKLIPECNKIKSKSMTRKEKFESEFHFCVVKAAFKLKESLFGFGCFFSNATY